MAPVHERLHKKDSVFSRRLDHSHRLGMIERHWFFAENMLSRFCRLNRPFSVKGMRGGNIHCLHFAICEEGFVTAVALWYIVLVTKSIRGFDAARSDRCQHSRFRLRQTESKSPCNRTGSNNSPFESWHNHSLACDSATISA